MRSYRGTTEITRGLSSGEQIETPAARYLGLKSPSRSSGYGARGIAVPETGLSIMDFPFEKSRVLEERATFRPDWSSGEPRWLIPV